MSLAERPPVKRTHDEMQEEEDDEKQEESCYLKLMRRFLEALGSYKFASTKGRITVDVHTVYLHFPDRCVPLKIAGTLSFRHGTPAYAPKEERLPLAEIVFDLEFDVPSFLVGDNPKFMAALPTLLLITCTTPIDDVARLELWSNSVGMLATRGFTVEPSLQPTQDPYAPGPHCSGGPAFVAHELGNVMQMKRPLTSCPSCLSFTLHGNEWKLSLHQRLRCNK